MADTVKISQNKAQKVCDVIRLAGRRMLRWISRPRPSISALLSGLIAAFLATLAPAAGALDAAALPTQGSVKVGSGSISQAGSQLTVQQNSQRLGLDWQSFNIGSSATVNFRQPGRDAIALNRVIGNSGSEIFGHLNANGQVFLVNPNGVLFAPGAQVDVGGLVASSLDMSQQDFSAGRYRFASSSGTPTGAVSNFGTLNATEGGYVALFAPQVSNAGSIAVRTGSVMLAAGSAVTVDITGSGLLSAVVTEGASQAIVVNSGSISAQAGSIRLDAKAADALAGSLVNNSGAIAANSLVEKDGAIWLTADQVTHSGSIDTSAKDLGKGGRVVVFGNDTAKVSGSINARGGAQGGDGGFIETSGRRLLDVTRAPDASAPKGKGGTWLLDPYNITIQAAGADTGITGNPSFLSGADDSVITTGTIEAALNAGTSVTVTTGIGGLQDGDITVASPITKSNGGSATLTLSPHNNLMINADITSSSGQLSMVFDPTEGDVVLGSNITLDTNGGSISALGKTVSHSLETVTINNSTFEMGTLNLSGGTLRGNGELIVTNAFNVTGSSTLSGLGLTTRGTSTVEMPGAFGGTFLWIEGSVFWRNEGVLNVSGDDYIYFDPLGDNELYNSGTINLGSTHDRPLENYVYGGLGVSTVFNSGTINLTAPGSHSFAPSLYNTGVLNVGNSSVLTFPNGVTDLEAGTQVTGALGISGGTLHINTDISLPSLTVNSGTLGGSADLTVTGPLEFAYNDAWITGPGKLTTLGTTTIDMPFGRFLTVDGGKTWVNDGTINLLGSAYIYGYGVNGDVTLTNNGTINFNSTHSTSILDYYGGTTLINHGTIKQIAVGTHEFGVYLENHGAIDIASNATLAVTREGRAELIPGTAFSGGGVFSVAGGSVYVNTPLTLSKMNISGGELGVSRDLTVTDTFDVTGYGTVFGLGQLLTQGIGTVSQPMYYMGSGGWRNTGTLNFNDPGRLILGAGAVLTNAPGGTININKTDLVIAGEYNNVGVLDNQGTLKKMQSGTSLIGDSSHVLESFTNAGRIEVSNGTLGVSSNNTNQTGTIEVAGSAVFEKYGGFTNAGTLRGAGTFAVGTGSTLVNNGTIAPGTTTGDTTDSLSITGDVQFGAGSTLNLELGGAGVGDYDALTVSGAVSGVAGSFGNLSLTRINGFTYGNRDTGDSFNLMTAGSGVNTGSFSTAHLLRTNLTPSHTATSYSLLVAPMVLTVDVGALTKVYGEGDPAVGYTVTGFDATTSDDVNIMTGSPVRTAGNNVGDYPFMIGTLATPFDYTIRFTSDSALSITPKMLSVNSVTASNKIYDGNTTATVSGSGLTGVINGDDVTLAGVTGTFDTKHAGTGKTVTISGGSLSGTGAGNYQIGSTAATTTANITKKELGVVTISADDKVYDGTRTATLSFGASTGVVAGDDVSLSGLAGTFDNKDVGAGKTVTVTGGSLIGTDAGNYQITSVAATTTADISQKELNFFSLTAANKVYDGNTTASVSFGGSSGVINGDDVVIAGLTGTFDNRNAGTGKTVTVRGGSLSGADAGNYFVNSGTGTTTADIAPLTVQLSSLSATNKVYDRTAVASVSAAAAPTNKVGVDDVSVTAVGLIGAFDDKNVGAGKAGVESSAAPSAAPMQATTRSPAPQAAQPPTSRKKI
jgi:filamentous hemagglutinin family protein